MIEAPIEIADEYVRKYLWEHNLTAIDEADFKKLAQPEPEPVGYLTNALGHEWAFTTKRINQYSQPVYYAPPQREFEPILNSVHCECGASWTFKDGTLNYKPKAKNHD